MSRRDIVTIEDLEQGLPVRHQRDVYLSTDEGTAIYKKKQYLKCPDGIYRDPCRKQACDDLEREEREGQQMLFCE